MALTWVEDKASRAATIVRLGSRGTATYSKSFKVFGTDDDLVLHNEINAYVQNWGFYWQYPGAGNEKLAIDSYSVSYLGDGAWQVTLSYQKAGADNDERPDPFKRSRSFDTTGGTQHITQALAETKYGTSAPDQKGAIAVDDDRVGGVDIVVPALQWTETYDVPHKYVTAAYIKSVAAVTGTTNSAAFRTFAKGEVLFIGCTGQQEWDSDRGDGPWSLSYRFIASPNAGSGATAPAITVGEITGIEKKGHEYMWVRYESAVDSSTVIKKPKAVYVNRVYREGDFSGLGLGVS
jgi:hypothetical protein